MARLINRNTGNIFLRQLNKIQVLPATSTYTMKQILHFPAVFMIFILLLTGCTSSLLKLYGMKEMKAVDEKMILQLGQEYNIPLEDSYQLDTAYATFLLSRDRILYKQQIKNHYQPLQALYFDKTGQLISFQVNCNAGGSPNLAWDRDSILTTFPPGQQTATDVLLSLNDQLKFLHPLFQTSKFNTADYDYIVVVYWNRFMNLQSKRFIKFMQDNSKLSQDKKVKIVYANNDNIFAMAGDQK